MPVRASSTPSEQPVYPSAHGPAPCAQDHLSSSRAGSIRPGAAALSWRTRPRCCTA